MSTTTQEPTNNNSNNNNNNNNNETTPLLQAQNEQTTTTSDEIQVDDDDTNKTNFFQALYHIVCVILGTGVLQLPQTLKESGFIGSLFIPLVGMVTVYTGNLIFKCMYYNTNGTRLDSFADISGVAFGRKGRFLIDFILSFVMLGTACVYFILIALNLTQLVGLEKRPWIVILITSMIIPFLGFKNLKEIAVFSLFGALTMLFVVGVVVYFSILNVYSDHDFTNHKVLDVVYIPQTVASISFSFAGNYVFPEVEKSMKNRKEFPKVIFWSIVIVSVLYILTAVLGYASYGKDTVSPIYLNLPPGAITFTCIWLTSISCYLSIPVLLHSLSLDLERKLDFASSSNEPIRRLSFRFGILLLVTIVSLSIPFFDDFMEFLGSFSNSLLIFVIPIVLDWKIFGFFDGFAGPRRKRDMFLQVFIVALGLVVFVIGSFRSLKALYQDIVNESS